MPKSISVFLIIVLGAFMVSNRNEVDRSNDDAVIENVRSFAKLYGYVRYFHPSDEAAATDWDRFAIHGVRKVQNVQGTAELQRVLESLFGPIAPTVQIYRDGQSPPALPQILRPADASGLELVAWQHKGVGLGTAPLYRSARLNRAETESADVDFGTLMQYFDAKEIRGREIRLRAAARADVEAEGGQLMLWLRVDRPDQRQGFFDNMADRPIVGAEWNTYEIVGPVAEDAAGIAAGALLVGDAKGWVDAISLETRQPDGAWEELPVENADFREGELGATPAGWQTHGYNHEFRIVKEDFDGDGRAAAIARVAGAEFIPGQLFPVRPEPGEILRRPIGSGLSVQWPIALYSRDGRTLPEVDSSAVLALRSALREIEPDSLTAEGLDLRLADIVIAWNILQHFYPYFDVVDTDWDAALTTALADTRDDTGTRDFAQTLNRMLSALHDGHAWAGHSLPMGYAGLQILTEMIEDEVVVIATGDSSQFEVGDIIRFVDRIPAQDVVEQEMAFQSGSDAWRRLKALRAFGSGDEGTSADVVLLRDGEQIQLSVDRVAARPLAEKRPPNVAEIADGIYYVNLSKAEMAEIDSHMVALSAAEGVIFDLRGYPRGNHAVLQHLTDDVIQSARWQIPQIIYPDQQDLVGYDDPGRWRLPPLRPKVQGTAVFLVNESAISYAESVMGIVEHYRLGEIIGRPTAGTNGNVNRIQLPGGFFATFTGMRVVKHDGSQHHLVGIRPTIPIDRTIAAVRDGRDEDLEKAIDVIKAQIERDPTK